MKTVKKVFQKKWLGVEATISVFLLHWASWFLLLACFGDFIVVIPGTHQARYVRLMNAIQFLALQNQVGALFILYMTEANILKKKKKSLLNKSHWKLSFQALSDSNCWMKSKLRLWNFWNCFGELCIIWMQSTLFYPHLLHEETATIKYGN